MCTVVFIPNKDSIYFASLRDEDPARKRATAPSLVYSNNGKYLAPIDPLGKGTWVGVNEYGNVIILLNGGFENHVKKVSYAKSRGIIVTELLEVVQPIFEWNFMVLNNIEPFTLVVYENKKLFQFVWDGRHKHQIQLSQTEAHIWSSATLYNNETKNKRAAFFKKWISGNPIITKLSVLDFFKSHAEPLNGFIMNRNEKVKTLSYTFIEIVKNNIAGLCYHDLSSSKTDTTAIALTTKDSMVYSAIANSD